LSSDAIAFVGNNVARFENGLYLCEGERTNLLAESNDPSAWSGNNLSARTDNYAVAPDGTVDAGRLVSDGVGNFNFASLQAAASEEVPYAGSAWLKDETNTGAHNYSLHFGTDVSTGTGAYEDGAIPPSAVWVRRGGLWTGGGTVVAVEAKIYVDSNASSAPGAASGDSLLMYGAQIETGRFPSSTIRTDGAAATRAADILQFADGSYPTRLRSGRWKFVFEPLFSSTEFVADNYFWTFGAAPDVNYIRLAAGNSLQVAQSTTLKVACSGITYSRYQRITVILDSVAGTVEIQGATTGNGVTAGTAWTMPSATRLNVGSREDGVLQCFCRLSEPYAA
jgi:hypothetical protein